MLSWPQFNQAAPIGTAFTYQGHLYDNNDVANDYYDFQFKLYDADVNGIQLGSDVNVPDVDVIDAYFTVELDFNDTNAFNGDARWLEIGVRPGEMNDPCEYIVLSPRQEVTATPYALYAANSGGDSDWMISGNDMCSAALGNVGIGTTSPGDKLDVNGHINSSESYKLDEDTVLSNTGTDNIFVGEDAGASITTGYKNSAIGSYALSSNTTGYRNSAMGYRALYTNTTGRENSAIGDEALRDNTEGGYNSAMGASALWSNTTGSNNSAMGFVALMHNTTGFYNTAIGSEALSSNTTGAHNTAIGSQALNSNTTGAYNSAIGLSALYYNTIGNDNTAVGYDAGRYNEEGSMNTLIGYEAGRGTSQHNKSRNVFLGYRAGYSETGDDKLYIENSDSDSPLIYGEFDNDIVAINGSLGIGTTSPDSELEVNGQVKITGGSPAEGKVLTSDASGLASWQSPPGGTDSDWTISDGNMYSVPSGNVGIGTDSPGDKLDVDGHINSSESYKLDGQTILFNTGTNNIFLGKSAGASITTGNNNSAVGYYALTNTNTGYSNSAIGFQALYYNTIGNENSATGYGALFANTEGNNNSAMGNSALYSNTTGNYNSAMGPGALENNTSGSYNTALGYRAGKWNVTGNGNVFIGYQAGSYVTDSNTLYIENSDSSSPLIYGEFDNDIVEINGTLSIGTKSHAEKLNINGHVNSSQSYKLDGQTVLSNTGTYNIFVGGEAGESIALGWGNSAVGYEALYSNTTGNHNSAIGYRVLYSNTIGSENSAIGYRALYSTTGNQNSAVGYRALYSSITGNGNTAIGTDALVNTDGSYNTAIGKSADRNNEGGSRNTVIGYEAGGSAQVNKSGVVFLGYQAGYYEMDSNTLCIENSSSLFPLIYGEFDNDIVAINGSLGIGAMSPDSELEVNGQVKITGGSPGAGKVLTSDASGLASWQTPSGGADLDWAISDGNMYSAVSGNVGIGTTNPARKLHINNVMRLEPRAAAPSSPAKGDIYMDGTTNKLMVYDGSTWQACW